MWLGLLRRTRVLSFFVAFLNREKFDASSLLHFKVLTDNSPGKSHRIGFKAEAKAIFTFGDVEKYQHYHDSRMCEKVAFVLNKRLFSCVAILCRRDRSI